MSGKIKYLPDINERGLGRRFILWDWMVKFLHACHMGHKHACPDSWDNMESSYNKWEHDFNSDTKNDRGKPQSSGRKNKVFEF